ncbi:GlcG/HbpS family heme-binding protein [Methylobacillus sp. Pita2]|uniref:GlcG/HbpS family heme-binding protein n=1 Tax=Methylobacillus sp. Pita2 TaxID=3383245 RepID=UPI0038B4D9C7
MTHIFRSTIVAAIFASYSSFGLAADIIGYGAPITSDQAKKAATAAIADAKKNNLAVVVAVVDSSGSLSYLEKIDGTQISSVETAIGKARTANNFKRPTKALDDVVAGGRVALLNLPNILPLQGGLPIILDGKIVGAIGVSGATSQQDEQAAAAGLAAIGAK